MGFMEQLQKARHLKSNVFERIENNYPAVERFLYDGKPNYTTVLGVMANAFSTLFIKEGEFLKASVAAGVGELADVADGEQATRQGPTSFGGFFDSVTDKLGEVARVGAMRHYAKDNGWKATARLGEAAETVQALPATARSILERENKIAGKKFKTKEQNWGSKGVKEVVIQTALLAPFKDYVWPLAMAYLTAAPVATAIERVQTLAPLQPSAPGEKALPFQPDSKKEVRKTLGELMGRQLLTRVITANADLIALDSVAAYSKIRAETATGERSEWGVLQLLPHALLALSKIVAKDSMKQYPEVALALYNGLEMLSNAQEVRRHIVIYPPSKGKYVEAA